ncbi:tyrosine-protein phosphatase [Thalassotalea euphylliae]|uniref:protein-tyrosine-phosphatase n=1 Tax=Thalassotalea euphylliae TaxID=1655234 RepID=A0A3E0UI39_9GAMM|nr:CpsB/CapC family capsule biosynthesis tyrosine phosphatase [Thalassotalea euphylliae]REL36550.1 capsule biosynthesis protein CapC [Thalassotalea euphylliae]
MYDLHSHVLPGIDDGAQSIDDTVALLKAAVDDGISHLIATPHIQLGRFDNTLSNIAAIHQQVIDHEQVVSLPIKLAFAAEIRICPEIMLLAKQQALPLLGQWHGHSVMLLELPHSHIPAGTEQLIKWLINQSIIPLIAHPERNRDIQADYQKFKRLAKTGCLFQLTASSITGDFGEHAQSIAEQIIKDNKAAIVASDMHSMKRRPPKMSQAYQSVSSLFGEEVANLLFVTNPQLIAESMFT